MTGHEIGAAVLSAIVTTDGDLTDAAGAGETGSALYLTPHVQDRGRSPRLVGAMS